MDITKKEDSKVKSPLDEIQEELEASKKVEKPIIDESKVEDNSENKEEGAPKLTATRKDLQLARRLFHVANGTIIGTLYLLFFSHESMIHILGTIACCLYIFEQIRVNYPELSEKLLPVTKFIIRAEEQIKESAMVPYAFAVLLCILTFPKIIAITGIFTLAVADPLSAIFGIKYGNQFWPRIVPHKSLEGSAAFLISTFFITFVMLTGFISGVNGTIFMVSILTALLTSAFEMMPLRIDDNLTIPLFTSFVLWILCGAFGIPLI